MFGNDDALPVWSAMPHMPTIDAEQPSWTDTVLIPSVYISRKDGLDLLQWVDSHSAFKQSVDAVCGCGCGCGCGWMGGWERERVCVCV